MHHPTDRITHTTAFVTPVVEHWLERDFFFIYKGRGMCYPVRGMNHIKDPLLLITSLMGYSLQANLNGPLPYVQRNITIKVC